MHPVRIVRRLSGEMRAVGAAVLTHGEPGGMVPDVVEPSGTRQPRILVVEDDEIIREAIRRTLVERGYHVLAASGGTEGLEAIRNDPSYDLAILDLRLPGLSGSQLLRYLEQESPQTEVIVISGYSSEEVRVDAVAHGAFTVLEKPFSITTLTDLVDRLLEPLRRTA